MMNAEPVASTSLVSLASSPRRSPSTGKVRGPGIVIDDPSKPRSRPRERLHPYVPGQYDAMLPIRAHPEPAELTGCAIEISPDRRQITVTECSPSRSPKHRITDEEAHYIEIALADGGYLQIEIRRFAAPGEDDGSDDGTDDDAPAIVRPSAPAPAPRPRTMAGPLLLLGVKANHG